MGRLFLLNKIGQMTNLNRAKLLILLATAMKKGPPQEESPGPHYRQGPMLRTICEPNWAPKGMRVRSPYRRNRQQANKQSPKVGERCQQRWKKERTFVCLQNFRRLVARYQGVIARYFSFFHPDGIIIALAKMVNGFLPFRNLAPSILRRLHKKGVLS